MTSNKTRAQARAEEFVKKFGAPPVDALTGEGEGAPPARSQIPAVVRPPKQTKGAMAAIDQTLALIPVKQVLLISLKELHVRPGYERDPSEFQDPEFFELVDSIRNTGGNTQPIDVREVRGAGHPTLYQIVTGERRVMALRLLNEESKKAHAADPSLPKERFTQALCNVRVLDEDMADQIHDLENAKRASKRPFSLAKQFSTMMKSGRYPTHTALAERIGRSQGGVSLYLKLYDQAPNDLWKRVKDPAALKHAEAELLVKAFDKPAFADWVKRLDLSGTTPVSTVVKKAKEACARPKKSKDPVDQVREIKRSKAYLIALPDGLVDPDIRKRALDAVKKIVAEG